MHQPSKQSFWWLNYLLPHLNLSMVYYLTDPSTLSPSSKSLFFVATASPLISPLIFPKHVFYLPLFDHYDIESSTALCFSCCLSSQLLLPNISVYEGGVDLNQKCVFQSGHVPLNIVCSTYGKFYA